MNPIQELKDEHRAIEGALTILESIAEEIENPTVQEDAGNMLDFLRTFADTCHHGKEEQVLFPGLEKMGVSRQNGPIGVMLGEHDLGRGHIRGMAQALEALAAKDPEAVEHFRHHAGSYVHLLRGHIAKEDGVLFAIADQRFSEDVKAGIQEEFDRIEREVVGQGRHEEFHRMLDRLAETYGVMMNV